MLKIHNFFQINLKNISIQILIFVACLSCGCSRPVIDQIKDDLQGYITQLKILDDSVISLNADHTDLTVNLRNFLIKLYDIDQRSRHKIVSFIAKNDDLDDFKDHLQLLDLKKTEIFKKLLYLNQGWFTISSFS